VKPPNVMNDRFRKLSQLLRGLGVGLSIAFVIVACNASKKLTKANVDEVIDGMSKKQVESILGPPTTVDTKDFVLLKKTTYLYAQGKESVTVIFKDDKVQSKASTLSE
jgi:outer membrane protein assembly factor BamE (lipoprotein component of BamABCDE complex)